MTNWVEKVTNWYFSRGALPYWCVVLLDCAAIVFSGMAAVYFCVGGPFVASHFWKVMFMWGYTIPLYLIGMRINRTYSGIIRYSSFTDLMRVALAILIGTGLTAIAFGLVPANILTSIPKFRVLCIMSALTVIFMWAIRIAAKYMYDTAVRDSATQRVFIYGVQEGGVALGKSMRNEHPRRYTLTGFLSDDENTIGRDLLSVKVYDVHDDVVERMKKQKATILFVSPLCSERFRENEALVNDLMKAGIKMMMLPVAESWDGKSSL